MVLFKSDEVLSVQHQEIDNCRHNDVYEEVDSSSEDVISVRWVITEKIKEGRPVIKARSVASCFEENIEFLLKDSPTCSKEAVRLMIGISASKGWECHSLDVKAAYLQGGAIDRDV